MKLEFSRHIFEKYSNIQFHENPFHENPFSGNRVVPCQQTDVRTDRHDVANSFFLLLIERAKRKRKQHSCNRHSLQYSVWSLYSLHESEFNC